MTPRQLPASGRPARAKPCRACQKQVPLPGFTMAFQPMFDLETDAVFAYEALVRPLGGGSAHDVLSQINDETRYAFDQACRVKAIELAASLGMRSALSINFLPNAVYQPAACLRRTLEAAQRVGFPLEKLIFEVTEAEQSRDPAHLRSIFVEYRAHGMITAIDDFGAGHSGLNMLADFQPDIVKLDMALCRNLHTDRVRRAIARSIISLCAELGIQVVCEGIETMEEAVVLRDLGVRYVQGFLFARPGFESLPAVPLQTLQAVRREHESHLLAADTAMALQARR